MTDQERYDNVLKYLTQKFPGFNVQLKSNSGFMRALGGFLKLVGMSSFMTQYTTTISRTVYRPDLDPDWDTLSHEGIHVGDDSFWYKLSYLFPIPLVILALGAVGAFWSLWCLLFLISLLALAPFPSPGRVHWERRGYLMTTVCMVIKYDPTFVRSLSYRIWMRKHFTGGDYYYMAWGKDKIAKIIAEDTEHAIKIATGEIYDPVYSWVLPLVTDK